MAEGYPYDTVTNIIDREIITVHVQMEYILQIAPLAQQQRIKLQLSIQQRYPFDGVSTENLQNLPQT